MRERLGMLRKEDLQQRSPFDGLVDMFEGDNYSHLTDGQRSRIRGFAGFLNLANLGIQWVDFAKRDKGLREGLGKKLEARALVVKAVYSVLYPEEVVPYQMPNGRRVQVQRTVVDFIDILYPVSKKVSLSPQEIEKIPQLTAFMRFLCNQWVPKQA